MKQYNELMKEILEHGEDRSDRTGVGTRALFGTNMRFRMADGFPAMTTKKLAWKAVVSELLWFLEGSTDERRLAEILYGKPRDELTNKTTIWTANADNQGKKLGYTNTDTEKELGPVYGSQWIKWNAIRYDKDDTSPYNEEVSYTIEINQIKNLIDGIKKDPYGRRHIVSAWNPGETENMALPPCHILFQCFVSNGKLSLQMYQRSADAALGVPFNIASYSLLLHMVAKECNLIPHEFIHVMGDTHIYHNHFDAVKEQLSRECRPLPQLWLNPEVKSVFDYKMDDIKLIGYDPHPAIPMPMAV